MTPDGAPLRLRGWHFVLFNVVLGLAHMAVLFNAASYIAFLPHVSGDLEGVLPSFGTWAQTDFMIALALAFPMARWLSGRFGDGRVFIGAFLAYGAASYLCAVSDSIAVFLPARVLLGFAGGLTLPIGQALLLLHADAVYHRLACGRVDRRRTGLAVSVLRECSGGIVHCRSDLGVDNRAAVRAAPPEV